MDNRRIMVANGIHPTAIVETDGIGAGASIGEYVVIRPGAVIGDGAVIHPNVVVEAAVEVGDGTELLPGSYLGRSPKAVGAIAREPTFRRRLTIGPGCSIGPNAIVYYDAEIGAETLVGDGASIRELCRIGARCVIGRHATLDRGVDVGDRTRVMDKAILTGKMRVGEDVFIAAGLVTTNDNTFGKAGYHEEDVVGPTVEDGAMIGGGAALLPGVVIGHGAIVGSGAVVTADVAPETLVLGVPARPVAR